MIRREGWPEEAHDSLPATLSVLSQAEVVDLSPNMIPALDEISKVTRQTLRDVESGSRATPTLT